MEKKHKLTGKDYMKLIVFSLLIVGVFVSVQIITAKQDTIKHNGVIIKASDYNNIKEQFNDYVDVVVCDIDDKQCLRLVNIDNVQEYLDFLQE